MLFKIMDKNCSMLSVCTNALKNFYGHKGDAKDLKLYGGHSKLSKAFVKLCKIANDNKM